MIKTLRFRDQGFDQSSSYTSSHEGGWVQAAYEQVQRDFASAESLDAPALREFVNTYAECSRGNWDGYDALPVSGRTYSRARSFLEQCLARVPAPVATATPSGSIAFEWCLARDRRLMVSIGDEDEIAFAGLFSGNSVHGTELFFGDVPPSVWNLLNRLFRR